MMKTLFQISSFFSLLLFSTLSSAEILNVAISAIQGSEHRSPLEKQWVSTQGVVTQIQKNRKGFWIQADDSKKHEKTSQAIYVYTPRRSAKTLNVGDRVEVTGKVTEYGKPPALTLTEIILDGQVKVLAHTSELPSATRLTSLPNSDLKQAADRWESIEGMRVSIDQAIVVAPTTGYGELAVILVDQAVLGSGYQPHNHHMLLRSIPNSDSQVDYNPEIILLDDNSLSSPVIASVGDRLTDISGVVDYSYGSYKIQLQDYQHFPNTMPKNVSLPDKTADSLRITSFNLKHLGQVNKNARHHAIQRSKLTKTIGELLKLPDIVMAQEVASQSALTKLASSLNQHYHSDYQAYMSQHTDNQIRLGFLWNNQTVNAQEFDNVPPSHEPSVGRRGLFGHFNWRGQTISLLNLHLKSKRGDDPLYARRKPRRKTENKRARQAGLFRNHIESWEKDHDEPWLIVGGDLNNFSFLEPGETINPVHLLQYGHTKKGPKLSNLSDVLHAGERFTYIYHGNSQQLDHLLASDALAQRVFRTYILHSNTPFPNQLSQDANSPLRSSDHDPVTIDVGLKPFIK